MTSWKSWESFEHCKMRIHPVHVELDKDHKDWRETYANLIVCPKWERPQRVYFLIVVEPTKSGLVIHLTNALLRRWGVTLGEVLTMAQHNAEENGDGPMGKGIDEILTVGDNRIDLALEFAARRNRE